MRIKKKFTRLKLLDRDWNVAHIHCVAYTLNVPLWNVLLNNVFIFTIEVEVIGLQSLNHFNKILPFCSLIAVVVPSKGMDFDCYIIVGNATCESARASLPYGQ